ncbi:MAG: hypothetical protein AAF604_06410 [Acidobacteriota bacterium]
MNGTIVVELVGATCLCATGISHWLHPEAWSEHFARLAEKGNAGALSNGLMHAGVGAFFVASHPVFFGWRALLTYWALAVLAKGLFYLVAPEVGVRSMAACTPERARRLRWAGLPMTILGLVVAGIALIP